MKILIQLIKQLITSLDFANLMLVPLLVSGLIISGTANATLITHTDSFGIVWTLESDGTNYGTTANPLYDVAVLADTTNFSTSSGGVTFTSSNAYINDISILASTSPTTGSITGPSTLWTNVLGGQNSNGCNGNGANFDCGYSTPGGNLPPTGPGVLMNFNQGNGSGKLEWLFQLGFASGTTFSQALSTALLGSHLKVDYYGYTPNQTGGQDYSFIGQISDDVTINNSVLPPPPVPDTVPEPGILYLLGAGLVGLGAKIRSKKA